jgi:hypothetical protein
VAKQQAPTLNCLNEVWVNPYAWDNLPLVKESKSARALSRELGFSYDGAVNQFRSGYRAVNAHLVLALVKKKVRVNVVMIDPGTEDNVKAKLKRSKAVFYAIKNK